MRNPIRYVFPLVFLFYTGCATMQSRPTADVSVNDLRCEYLTDPLGLGEPEPRLSWILRSSLRGCEQSAFRIIVASSPEKLALDIGDLWDTGKINSDRTNQIAYAGKPLKSRMRCFWKVRVWDNNDRVTAWSRPASWTMGLLNGRQWQAQWIGYDAPTPESHKIGTEPDPLTLEGCNWVWFDEPKPREAAPIGTRYFREVFEVPAAARIKRARMRLIADNEGSLYLNGSFVQKFQGWNPPYTLDITAKLKKGLNTVAIAVENQGQAPNPAGLGGKLLVEFESGDPLAVAIDNSCKAADTSHNGWKKADFDDSGWSNAKTVAPAGAAPWGPVHKPDLVLPPPPYLRREFEARKPVERATLYATALGLYRLHVNGKRVGNDYFTPGWTDYPTRVYYHTYDVTGLVESGSNAIAAVLADGWYAGYLGFGRKREHYGEEPRLLARLEIEYADGTSDAVVTDRSWKATYGPHLDADFLMGETYDARLELPGWTRPGYDDSGWAKVAVAEEWPGKLQAYPGVAVRRVMELDPKSMTEPQPGVYVYDMGQNFAGIVRLKARSQRGDKLTLRFAEMLNPDGTIYTTNLREARCTDTFICSGDEQSWTPSFTYHGFRYVELTGCRNKPPLNAVKGIVLQSDTPRAGQFECSDPMVNQLYQNIVWSQRGNFIEVPTDCPQRDERLGWTGDAQIFIRTATYNMDVAAFFTKWLVDLVDAQTPEGAFPDVAPQKVAMGAGVAAWGDAGVICPWTIHRVYGDERIIRKHYDAMAKWIAWLEKNSDNLIRPDYGYGDWVSINSDTPKDIISTAYFAYSTRLLSEMAAAAGRTEDARKYEQLFNRIKTAFNKAFVSQGARIKGETQTCYLLALHFDLLPSEKRAAAAAHLVADIKERDYHLSTGFVGLSYLLPVLTETGYEDVAFKLLLQDTFPSWGYSIKNGATTIWERWDGWTEEKGFQDPGMNSFNHYAFGSVGAWLFSTVAGIDTQDPGYGRIRIEPHPGSLTYAKAAYHSIRGPITTHWRVEENTFVLDVSIPPNTTATVSIPAKNLASVEVDGVAAERVDHVDPILFEDGRAVLTIASGTYRFESALD